MGRDRSSDLGAGIPPKFLFGCWVKLRRLLEKRSCWRRGENISSNRKRGNWVRNMGKMLETMMRLSGALRLLDNRMWERRRKKF